MKMTTFLSGLLLFFLLPHWTQTLENRVDIQTLARIIKFLEQHYKRVGGDGYSHQYATAINVPVDQCLAGFNPSQNNFLPEDEAHNVKNAISDDSNALYQGKQLIAAGVKISKSKSKSTKKYNYHSENLLLRPVNNSPMTKLLDKNNQDCSIFYTLNSPCFGTCLNEQGPYNILKALADWSTRGGIKAFVFKNFWRHDIRKDVQSKFKLIASRVPLYRCVSDTVCYACKGEGNTAIDENCLPPPTTTLSKSTMRNEL